MKFYLNTALRLAIILVLASGSALTAEDTGKMLTSQCRQNLKMLNETIEKFIKRSGEHIPAWAQYATIKTSLLSIDDLPKDPEAPTPDCKYYLISNSRDDFQWYCGLHGVFDGEKTITFQYHEHRTIAKTTDRYLTNKRYQDHISDLLRWTSYTPTPVERFKYHYNMNPLSTILLLSGTVLVLWFVYRSL